MSDFLANLVRRAAGLTPHPVPHREPSLLPVAEFEQPVETPERPRSRITEAAPALSKRSPQRSERPTPLTTAQPSPAAAETTHVIRHETRMVDERQPSRAPIERVPPPTLTVRTAEATEHIAGQPPAAVAPPPAPRGDRTPATAQPPRPIVHETPPATIKEVRNTETHTRTHERTLVAPALPAAASPILRTRAASPPQQQTPPVEVKIGRIEIRQTPPLSTPPPAPAPRRTSRGFDAISAARRYADRRWY